MSHYCPVEVRAARMYEDPEPAEFCENEVEADGDVCGFHDYPDDDDWTRE